MNWNWCLPLHINLVLNINIELFSFVKWLIYHNVRVYKSILHPRGTHLRTKLMIIRCLPCYKPLLTTLVKDLCKTVKESHLEEHLNIFDKNKIRRKRKMNVKIMKLTGESQGAKKCLQKQEIVSGAVHYWGR